MKMKRANDRLYAIPAFRTGWKMDDLLNSQEIPTHKGKTKPVYAHFAQIPFSARQYVFFYRNLQLDDTRIVTDENEKN